MGALSRRLAAAANTAAFDLLAQAWALLANLWMWARFAVSVPVADPLGLTRRPLRVTIRGRVATLRNLCPRGRGGRALVHFWHTSPSQSTAGLRTVMQCAMATSATLSADLHLDNSETLALEVDIARTPTAMTFDLRVFGRSGASQTTHAELAWTAAPKIVMAAAVDPQPSLANRLRRLRSAQATTKPKST